MALFDVQIDALYFHPSETGVSYAIHKNKVLNPDFHAQWGARGIVGASLCDDQWRVWLSFLHYHARTRSCDHDGGYQPTWPHPALLGAQEACSVDSLWRLHLGLADGGLSYCWSISECLDLNLTCFLRYAEVRHKLKIDYHPGADFSMKNKFWGIGPGFGGEGLYSFNRWLSVFGEIAFNLSFGKFYVHQDQEFGQKEVNVFNEFCQSEPIFNGALGLQSCLCGWTLRVAWEIYTFFNQNHLPRFVDQKMQGAFLANGGCLSLQGLSLGIGLKF